MFELLNCHLKPEEMDMEKELCEICTCSWANGHERKKPLPHFWGERRSI